MSTVPWRWSHDVAGSPHRSSSNWSLTTEDGRWETLLSGCSHPVNKLLENFNSFCILQGPLLIPVETRESF